MPPSSYKDHDGIHKALFQTLFPYAIQAMYPALHEQLDYTELTFIKEEYQIPTTASYFNLESRFIDILAQVPLKTPLKQHLKIELGPDQKPPIDPEHLAQKYKDLIQPNHHNRKPKLSQPEASFIRYESNYALDDVKSQKILIHIELERTSNLIEMSQRMREYFNILSQQSKWSNIIPLVVFFQNGHPSGLRWVTVRQIPFDQEISQFRFISWGLSKENPLYWLEQNNPIAIPLAAFMDTKKLDPVELKFQSHVAILENPALTDEQKANVLDHINAYQELDAMNKNLFDSKLYQYQKKSDLEMTVTQRLVVDAKREGKAEGELIGKLKAKHEMITRLLELLKIDCTSTQKETILAISNEAQLNLLYEGILLRQQSLEILLQSILQ